MHPPLLEMRDTTPKVAEGRLVIGQRDRGILLNPAQTAFLVLLPAYNREGGTQILAGIIDEDLQASIALALTYVVQTLDDLDADERMHHVTPIAALYGVQHLRWQTRAEQAQSPDRMTINLWGAPDSVVNLDPAAIGRRVLATDGAEVAADLTALLRQRMVNRSP